MSVTTQSTGRLSMGKLDSSAVVLVGDATYTSAAFDITRYKELRISAYADQVGATDGIVIMQSQDGTNYDKESSFTYDTLGDKAQGFFTDVMGIKGKIKFTNGGTGQGPFRIFVFGIP